MATSSIPNNDTPAEEVRESGIYDFEDFTTDGHDTDSFQDVLAVKEEADKLALIDAINERFTQVDAQLLAIAFEDGLKHFQNLTTKYQGAYLWAVRTKIHELKCLSDTLYNNLGLGKDDFS